MNRPDLDATPAQPPPPEPMEQRRIVAYLADHKVPCPKCRYPLFALDRAACPECGARLSLMPMTLPNPWRKVVSFRAAEELEVRDLWSALCRAREPKCNGCRRSLQADRPMTCGHCRREMSLVLAYQARSPARWKRMVIGFILVNVAAFFGLIVFTDGVMPHTDPMSDRALGFLMAGAVAALVVAFLLLAAKDALKAAFVELSPTWQSRIETSVMTLCGIAWMTLYALATLISMGFF